MSLAEMLTLLALIVSLLALIAHTFDIVWRISHDDKDSNKKK